MSKKTLLECATEEGIQWACWLGTGQYWKIEVENEGGCADWNDEKNRWEFTWHGKTFKSRLADEEAAAWKIVFEVVKSHRRNLHKWQIKMDLWRAGLARKVTYSEVSFL